MANVKKVAQVAEVSVATVSRVISGSSFVSPDLTERVYKAMETLKYRPSQLARGLRTQQTYNVGVLIPQIDHPFFSSLTFGVEKALFEKNYRCFVCSTEEDSDKENAYVEALLGQQVGGLIIVPTTSAGESVQKFVEQRVPVVLVDRDLPDAEVDRVLSDNHRGAYELACYILGLGHRDVTVIGTSADSRAMTDRVRGIEQAFAEADTAHTLRFHFQEPLAQFRAGYEIGLQVLSSSPRPTAVMALTDVIAVGVLHAGSELNLDVPRELSVTGFDDIPLASHVIPSLTTVSQPLQEMGGVAAELMLCKIKNPSRAPQQTILPTRLVVRHSTADAKEYV